MTSRIIIYIHSKLTGNICKKICKCKCSSDNCIEISEISLNDTFQTWQTMTTFSPITKALSTRLYAQRPKITLSVLKLTNVRQGGTPGFFTVWLHQKVRPMFKYSYFIRNPLVKFSVDFDNIIPLQARIIVFESVCGC